MEFSYTKTLHNLVIHSPQEEQLQQMVKYLESYQLKDLVGHLWIGSQWQDDQSFDYLFWLERCQVDARAFRYNVENDEKELLDLAFTTFCERPNFDHIEYHLPLTRKGSKSAFFLDRDGIINEDRAYVYKREEVKFQDGLVEFIQFLQDQYDYVIVLTNQSGIGRGYYKEEDVLSLHQWMQEDLEKSEARINGWYYCPYHPTGEVLQYRRDSYLRKPGSGMALIAAEDFDLDLKRCAMVGDKDSDFLEDLQLETFFIQGNYPIQNKGQKFISLSELQKYLTERK